MRRVANGSMRGTPEGTAPRCDAGACGRDIFDGGRTAERGSAFRCGGSKADFPEPPTLRTFGGNVTWRLMPYQPFDTERVLGRLLNPAIFAGGAVLFISIGLREPIPPPANAWAYGCYVTQNSPPIIIEGSGIRPLDGQARAVPFRLEWDDGGIILWPAQRIVFVREQEGGISYQVEDGPGNAFLFVTVVGGNVYPGVNKERLETFQVSTHDGNVVAFHRVAMETCGDPA